MARKGEKSKSKKSPDKSPRRGCRPSRRRKKSETESSEEPETKKTEAPIEVPSENLQVKEEPNEVTGGRTRRSSRRLQGSHEESATVATIPTAAPEDWKEDQTFWSAGEKTEAVEKTVDGEEVWKVQSSNGSGGGEIQKLRICRQRLHGSDSADASSPSPVKDVSSPSHKRKAKSVVHEGIPGSVSEIDLPPDPPEREECEVNLDTLPLPDEKKEIDLIQVPEPPMPQISEPTRLVDKPEEPSQIESKKEEQNIVVKGVDVKSMVEETSVSKNGKAEEKVKEELASVPVPVDVNLPEEAPPIPDQLPEKPPDQAVEQNKIMSEESILPDEPPPLPPTEEKRTSVVDSKKDLVTEDNKQEVVEKATKSIDDVQSATNASNEASNDSKMEQTKAGDCEISSVSDTIENIQTPVEVISSDTSEAKQDIKVPSDDAVKADNKNEEIPTPPPEAPASNEGNEQEVKALASIDIPPLRRQSDSSNDEKDNIDKVKTIQDENSNDNTVLKIGLDKEEGELESSDEKKIDIKSSLKVAVTESNNRRNETIKEKITGVDKQEPVEKQAAQPAQPMRKHPIITGPDSDDGPSARRRKISTSSNPPRVVTAVSGGRHVRSIPGEAIKAILSAPGETEKKEKREIPKPEKSPIVSSTPVRSVKLIPVENKKQEPVVRKVVEDFREVLNKSAEKRSIRVTTTTSVPVSAPALPPTSNNADRVPVIKKASSEEDENATRILFITNLVRPFTAGQLKELLARTGSIADNGFYIDKIKSKCFVKYVDKEMAIETRHALNGVRWPVGNPKTLKVVFATEKDMASVQESAENQLVEEVRHSGWLSEQAAFNESKKANTGQSVREWDVGKLAKDGEETNKTDGAWEKDKNKDQSGQSGGNLTDRKKRKLSPSRKPSPVRKNKKNLNDASAKLLDDLFRITTTTPCLYWLPLTAAQIAVKGEMRRKHMQEHERRMAELKKTEQLRRDKERDRRRK